MVLPGVGRSGPDWFPRRVLVWYGIWRFRPVVDSAVWRGAIGSGRVGLRLVFIRLFGAGLCGLVWLVCFGLVFLARSGWIMCILVCCMGFLASSGLFWLSGPVADCSAWWSLAWFDLVWPASAGAGAAWSDLVAPGAYRRRLFRRACCGPVQSFSAGGVRNVRI